MPRVIVFDFDSTLASCEVGIFSLKDATNLAFGGHDRVEMLRNLLESLHRRGIKLVIVSYNSKHVIEKALADKKVDLLHFFNHKLSRLPISTEDRGHSVMGWESFAPRDVLFIDDDPENIHDVANNVPGCQTLHAQEHFRIVGSRQVSSPGITKAHCSAILVWADYGTLPQGLKSTLTLSQGAGGAWPEFQRKPAKEWRSQLGKGRARKEEKKEEEEEEDPLPPFRF